MDFKESRVVFFFACGPTKTGESATLQLGADRKPSREWICSNKSKIASYSEERCLSAHRGASLSSRLL